MYNPHVARIRTTPAYPAGPPTLPPPTPTPPPRPQPHPIPPIGQPVPIPGSGYVMSLAAIAAENQRGPASFRVGNPIECVATDGGIPCCRDPQGFWKCKQHVCKTKKSGAVACKYVSWRPGLDPDPQTKSMHLSSNPGCRCGNPLCPKGSHFCRTNADGSVFCVWNEKDCPGRIAGQPSTPSRGVLQRRLKNPRFKKTKKTLSYRIGKWFGGERPKKISSKGVSREMKPTLSTRLYSKGLISNPPQPYHQRFV